MNYPLETEASPKGWLDHEVSDDPFKIFAQWYDEAETSEPNDPNAMALATADADGFPDVRMVLLKGYDTCGFVFYTNLESRKGQELRANMRASGVLHWKTLRKQVRFRGVARQVADAEADAYFASRARDSRIGAWASQQSRPLASREELLTAVEREAGRFPAEDIPRPPHWTGIRIVPLYIEFWREQPFRLHDRLVFERGSLDEEWKTGKLYP